MKKFIVFCTIVYALFAAAVMIRMNFATTYAAVQDMPGVKIISKASGSEIMISRYGRWEKTYLKGVDLGSGKPGAFPGDYAISRQEYLRWLEQIAELGANTVRVYTVLSPEFYDAFYSYNKSHLQQLYLIQGVWVDENRINTVQDAYDPLILDQFIQDTRQAIDVIHGNAGIKPTGYAAGGKYSHDISPWVIGYILGVEWDGGFVLRTNERNRTVREFRGDFLQTSGASPFECFLAQVGDQAIAYETEQYGEQRLLAFSNWPVTDPLAHSGEEESVNIAEVNVEHILATANFASGQFASYHAYPYYPDFLNFQQEYQELQADGTVNPYQAYLRNLVAYHRMPVLISEYGVPSSRGVARLETSNHYNQGNLTETQQGQILAELTRIIHDSGSAGGLIFSWQDEWFKRTWNTMDFSLPDSRPLWSDAQTNEQFFGLLSFDPGRKRSVVTVDGQAGEWGRQDQVVERDGISLSAQADEKFLYLRIHKTGLDLAADHFLIPLDVTPRSGIRQSAALAASFSRPADFLLSIHGREDSRLLVHDYYDAFTFNFSRLLYQIDPRSKQYRKNGGDFTKSYLAIRAPLWVEASGTYSPPVVFETGRLVYGSTDPAEDDSNTLADFCAAGEEIEIRIPWGLLNFMDPASRQVMDDFYIRQGIKPLPIDAIYLGIGLAGSGLQGEMHPYTWDPWEEPTYHERLKQSYPLVQQAFQAIQ